MNRMRIEKRVGLTIIELLVVILIIGVVIGMLLPAVGRNRGASRRTQCLNNLRQIALASINFESANMHFPSAVVGSEFGGQAGSISGFALILPYMEENARFKRISEPSTIDGRSYPAWPDPLNRDFTPWQTPLPSFVCPSLASSDAGFAPIHYGMIVGDRARNFSAPTTLRGVFGGELEATFDMIADGSSNTFFFTELGSVGGAKENLYAINQARSLLENPSEVFALTDDGKLPNYRPTVSLSELGRGAAWADGRAGIALVNTILPPNSPSAAVGAPHGADGIYSASGPHPGTINVAMCDGSTHAISVDIDAGDSSSPTLTEQQMLDGVATAYGVWGKLGTIAGGEVVDVTDW